MIPTPKPGLLHRLWWRAFGWQLVHRLPPTATHGRGRVSWRSVRDAERQAGRR